MIRSIIDSGDRMFINLMSVKYLVHSVVSFVRVPPVKRNILSRITSVSKSSMSSANSTVIAICQMTSTNEIEKNYETGKKLIESAREKGAKMVFLPECFDFVGESKKQSVEMAGTLDGRLLSKYRDLAASNSTWLSLGGFHEKAPESNKIFNSHVMISDKGEVVSVYRKTHLFDVDIPGGVQIKESDYVNPGKQIAPPIQTPVGKVGLGICYDMRFPEFSLSIAKAGAEILTFPSAFMPVTGKAHWESLLRCRAIETQCYVVAAAQIGQHNPKRSSYGHAIVVDPWGKIIAACGDGTEVTLAEINRNYLQKVRLEMPVWLHRRPELYGEILQPKVNTSESKDSFKFGPIEVIASQIFYRTQHSVAFVNKKPVIAGHVLVSSLRCAERLSDLTASEISDIFLCVQRVQKVIENVHQASSSTIAVQDGQDAGQSIPHVHVHILPRKPGDFKNVDDVYKHLESHDKEPRKKWRPNEEMEQEANMLRKHFCL